jgi:hypothetical protein
MGRARSALLEICVTPKNAKGSERMNPGKNDPNVMSVGLIQTGF